MPTDPEVAAFGSFDDLESAIASGRGLQEAMSRVDQEVFDAGELPQAIFEKLLALLGSPALMAHRDAIRLVKLFDDQADLLDAAQRSRAAQAMLPFFVGVRDDLAAFLAAEVWVALAGAGRVALDGLGRLERECGPGRLAVLVHGFDWLCKKAQDAQVRDDCMTQLMRLTSSSDGAVAREARSAITRRGGER